MLRGGGNGARKGHGQGVGGKRREREEAREGRGAGEAKDRTRNGAVPGRAHFGRAHNNINIMSRSGRARGKREEGTAEKTRADGGEDRRSGRRGRREERSAEKTGGADGGEDRRSGRRGRRDETAKKRQKTAGCGPTTRRACNVWFTAHYARKTGVSAPADNRL